MDPSPFLDAGRHVGAYEIRREIARGGMAVVYEAYHAPLDRDVALKELAVTPIGNATIARRFALESHLVGGLSHPNVVTVFDCFESGGRSYIAMEYLERGSLRPLVGSLELPQIAGVLEGVLAGLAHAETRRIVHRDLKPENLLVTADGRVKIADFGIAKAYDDVPLNLTATGTTIGTPSYMAPEQAMGHDVGPWTDLYAVGVIAFELLTRELPFKNNDWSVLMQHVHDPVPAPRVVSPDLDERLESWLLALLEKDPARRPQSAVEAWEQLEDAVVALCGPVWRREARLGSDRDGDARKPLSEAEFPSVVTRTPGRNATAPVPPAAPRPRRRWRRALGAAIAVLVLGGSGAAAALHRPAAGAQLDLAAVERTIRTDLEQQYGVAAVDCPPSVPARPGASFECVVTTTAKQRVDVTVEQGATPEDVTVTPHL